MDSTSQRGQCGGRKLGSPPPPQKRASSHEKRRWCLKERRQLQTQTTKDHKNDRQLTK